MIENPTPGMKVEVQMHPPEWRPGVIEDVTKDIAGQPWCHVLLDSGAHDNYLAASASIRPAPPKKRSPPGPSVLVRVRAEIELVLPSPWTGEETHNNLVPIAQREARALLEKHLRELNARLISIHTIQTVVSTDVKEKP